MMLRMSAVFSGLLLAVGMLAHGQAGPERYSLHGRLVDRFTGKPLSGVEVTIGYVWYGSAAEPVVSDKDGRFTFADLQPGEYILGAILNHVALRDGERRTDKIVEWHSYLVGPGIREEAVVLRVAPPSVLTGTVRNEYGDPMPGGRVAILKEVWSDGSRALDLASPDFVDDLGRYRIAGLAPGNYKVCAIAEGEAPALVTLDLKATNAARYYVPACHPANGVFRIGPGENPEIDLTVASSSGVSVRGRIVGARSRMMTGVTLIRAEALVAEDLERSTEIDDAGNFEFRGVSPGRYVVKAETLIGRGAVGRRAIEVGGSDVKGVELQMEWRPNVEVVLHAPDDARDLASKVRVGLRSATPGDRQEYWAEPEADFGEPLDPGTYWLVTRGGRDASPSPGVCVTSATFDGREVLFGPIHLNPGADGRLAITVSEECAAIRGLTVLNGKPAPFSNVALLRSGSAQEPGDVQTLVSGADGSFEMAAMIPGPYLLWAWPENDAGPPTLAGVENQATLIVMRAGQLSQPTAKVLRPGTPR
jgi:hypothetical protein